MTRSIALIDGQHYPTVIERTIDELRRSDQQPVAAVFLGGSEKTAGTPELSIPVLAGNPVETLERAIRQFSADVVVDLSDEPVLDYRSRFALVAVALAGGLSYVGSGYRIDPPVQPVLTEVPTVSVTGTGKRTGKTAVAIELARHWRQSGVDVVIVTMGRGGPPDPILLAADEFAPTVEGLTAMSDAGLHAASDYVEDAVFAGVDTVGTFRCGAGIAGGTDHHNFSAGVQKALSRDPALLIYEGSGTAIPPAAADASVLVMPATIDQEFLNGYLGPYRVRSATVAVVIDPNREDKDAAEEVRRLLRRINPRLQVFDGHYALETSAPVAGHEVFVATTAPELAAPHIRRSLLAAGAASVATSHNLSNRARLVEDLKAHRSADTVLIEVKAAAIEVVVPWARSHGVTVGLIHNRVDIPGGTGEIVSGLADQLRTS